MQAILTKVIPATNTRPTRIKASCARGSLTVAYDYAHDLGDERTHAGAANALRVRFLDEDEAKYNSDRSSNPWNKNFISGCLPSGDFCHVFTT